MTKKEVENLKNKSRKLMWQPQFQFIDEEIKKLKIQIKK